jgi:hypothetical protein
VSAPNNPTGAELDEHAVGVTITGPLCPAIAAVLVFVAP